MSQSGTRPWQPLSCAILSPMDDHQDHHVVRQVDPDFARGVSEEPLLALARQVLASEGVEPGTELSVLITDDETIRDLNQRFRDVDEPTDVLSFGLEDGEEFATPSENGRQLGEVVISFPTAQRQAEEAGHAVERELCHLLVHGILHILGHDHEAPDEAREMHAKEEALLGGWRH